MANQKIKIMNIKHLYAYLIAFFSSVLTFIFFYFSNEIIKEEKIVKKEIDIYKNMCKHKICYICFEPCYLPANLPLTCDCKYSVHYDCVYIWYGRKRKCIICKKYFDQNLQKYYHSKPIF